tara:strand:+ start:57915 stop:58274 length:360 start_codon:yes stop_codon:yes gene_type:complete
MRLTIQHILTATGTPNDPEHSNEKLREWCVDDEETWNHPASIATEFAADVCRLKECGQIIRLPHWEQEAWADISHAYKMILWANVWLLGLDEKQNPFFSIVIKEAQAEIAKDKLEGGGQ